jgi:hypothetical protein
MPLNKRRIWDELFFKILIRVSQLTTIIKTAAW